MGEHIQCCMHAKLNIGGNHSFLLAHTIDINEGMPDIKNKILFTDPTPLDFLNTTIFKRA